ncbi:MAG: hypothetical protein HC896_09395 [Bacteroidales bacterium]|nr:hypothetical protein [Bacteroidales bacterium]
MFRKHFLLWALLAFVLAMCPQLSVTGSNGNDPDQEELNTVKTLNYILMLEKQIEAIDRQIDHC